MTCNQVNGVCQFLHNVALKADQDNALPIRLDIVGSRVSNSGLEDGTGQRGHVHHQTLNQGLQAGY